MLPFFDALAETRNKRPALVPVASLVGSSHKWAEYSKPGLPEKTAEEWEAYFCDEARVNDDPAHATVIRSLGLFFIGGEGKNRVAFLARRGVELLPCVLTEVDYPAAERLKVIEVFEGPFRVWLCSLDEDWVCTIP